eukprot:TRINITY_DN3975_c0_g1_i1.p1 TRINITY_DN3975_c0_g1~~TRINITY_DN3975_c0_g1_i1.p1  ORF type:complete len:399 (+),score=177.70 TRINITY_DN3975_c0_g1_i1:66-1262(+)
MAFAALTAFAAAALPPDAVLRKMVTVGGGKVNFTLTVPQGFDADDGTSYVLPAADLKQLTPAAPLQPASLQNSSIGDDVRKTALELIDWITAQKPEGAELTYLRMLKQQYSSPRVVPKWFHCNDVQDSGGMKGLRYSLAHGKLEATSTKFDELTLFFAEPFLSVYGPFCWAYGQDLDMLPRINNTAFCYPKDRISATLGDLPLFGKPSPGPVYLAADDSRVTFNEAAKTWKFTDPALKAEQAALDKNSIALVSFGFATFEFNLITAARALSSDRATVMAVDQVFFTGSWKKFEGNPWDVLHNLQDGEVIVLDAAMLNFFVVSVAKDGSKTASTFTSCRPSWGDQTRKITSDDDGSFTVLSTADLVRHGRASGYKLKAGVPRTASDGLAAFVNGDIEAL